MGQNVCHHLMSKVYFSFKVYVALSHCFTQNKIKAKGKRGSALLIHLHRGISVLVQ